MFETCLRLAKQALLCTQETWKQDFEAERSRCCNNFNDVAWGRKYLSKSKIAWSMFVESEQHQWHPCERTSVSIANWSRPISPYTEIPNVWGARDSDSPRLTLQIKHTKRSDDQNSPNQTWTHIYPYQVFDLTAAAKTTNVLDCFFNSFARLIQ